MIKQLSIFALLALTLTACNKDEVITASGSSRFQNKVYEWTPAPGQFINEQTIGGMTGAETTSEAARTWAEKRLKGQQFVSLGGFGGYIIVGFDHRIVAHNEGYDFAVYGNAFDSSSEPGVVYVMQDTNGNKLPDDIWYELKGSESDKATTLKNYSVTYFRPSAKGQNVRWEDSEGQQGTIDYTPLHDQDFYYPAWIPTDSYELKGTRLAPNNIEITPGQWSNRPYDWGYVDNFGSDKLGTGNSACIGFRIANAMQTDGTPANLDGIDFIKVQCAVNTKSGILGEVSTEVCGFEDLWTE